MISTQDVETLPGTPVLDSDGDKVGDVAQVYVSDEGSEPLFVTVKTGLFGTKETFVPLDSATLVQGALHVRYDKATIKDAPRVEADDHLSDDEQDGLFDYYDQHGGAARDLDRSSAQGADRPANAAIDADRTDAGRRDDAGSIGSGVIGGGAIGGGAAGRDAADAGRTGSDDAAVDRGRDALVTDDAGSGTTAAYDAGGADAFGGAAGGVQGAPVGDVRGGMRDDEAAGAGDPAAGPEGYGTTGDRTTGFDAADRSGAMDPDAGTTAIGGGAPGAGMTGAGTTAATPGSVQRTDDGSGDADRSITLSEERLNVGTRRTESGRARLRKHVVTEQRTVTVPVSHDELRVEHEPIGVDEAASMPAGEIGEDSHEVVLTEERPVVDTEVVPVERVRLSTEQVTEQREVTGEVRHEELDDEGLNGTTR